MTRVSVPCILSSFDLCTSFEVAPAFKNNMTMPTIKTRDLDSTHFKGRSDMQPDPKTTGPTENLREKASKTIDESEDSEVLSHLLRV